MTVTVNPTCVDQAARKTNTKSLWTRIADMLNTRHQRKALKDLDEHMLRDIGITRQEAEIEAEKPVWDVPRHWSQ
ncbi:MAG: DUF1127 domain-containing protein [Pseudomonadota bacterium]